MNTAEHYQAKLNLPYVPSDYQSKVLNWVEIGRGSRVIGAVAGSGKSSTLEMITKLLDSDVLVLAFSKEIEKEFKKRLNIPERGAPRGSKIQVKTCHSHGLAAIGFSNNYKWPEVEPGKYRQILRGAKREYDQREVVFGRRCTEGEIRAIQQDRFPLGDVIRLFDLARCNLIRFEADNAATKLRSLIAHHALPIAPELDDLVIHMVCHLAKVGPTMLETIDYGDMVWLPCVMNWRPKQYSYVLVDECQDINRAQRWLIERSVRRGGRIIYVGDRNQAIFGFAGANSESFDELVISTKAEPLPLSVSYRCPRKVIELAQTIVPHIEAAPNAIEGEVLSIQRADLLSHVQEGDMILSRTNAPLLKACFELIADGVAASVRGRAIGEGLCRIVDKIAKSHTWEMLLDGIEDWASKQCDAIRKRGGDDEENQERFEIVYDQATCLKIIYSGSEATSFEALKSAVSDLFSDARTSVQLSSVHRAKGLEADRVFIIDPDRLRKPRAARPWQLQQERNLFYVAVTRAKRALYFVEGAA